MRPKEVDATGAEVAFDIIKYFEFPHVVPVLDARGIDTVPHGVRVNGRW